MNRKVIFGAALLVLVRAAGQAQNVPVAITYDYDAQGRVLLMHATNNSGKDIIAYSIRVQRKNPDGTLDRRSYQGTETDMLPILVNIQMAKDPAAEEREWREHGIYAPLDAGTTRDISMPGAASPDNAEVKADVVFYADGTFDGQDSEAFKAMLAHRQKQLLEMKKANEIMRFVLADTSIDHPIAAAITELAKAAGEPMAPNPDSPPDLSRGKIAIQARAMPTSGFFFNGDIMSLRNLRAQSDAPERELLTQYVEKRERQAELMTPHCHLEIALK